MAVIRIPTSTDPTRPRYAQITGLDGSEYQLSFEFNQRDGFWYLTLQNQDGVTEVAGLRLVTNWPLKLGLVSANLPPGDLTVCDLRGRADSDPGLEELGNRFELLYVTEG